MEPYIERDERNKRTVAMFEQFGMRFRSNTVERGGQIELHVHSFDHMAAVHGEFEVTLIALTALKKRARRAASKPFRRNGSTSSAISVTGLARCCASGGSNDHTEHPEHSARAAAGK